MPVGTWRRQVPQRRRLRAPRRADRAGQHVPPDAAARRRRRRPLRRARAVRRLGRADAHRFWRLPGVLARAEGRRRRRDVPQHVRRVDASAHPGSRRARPGATRSGHPDGPRRLPAAAEPARRRRVGGQAHRVRGGERSSHRRADQALFGIVQGGTSAELRRTSAEHTAGLDFDGYGIGGLSVRGDAAPRWLPPSPPRSSRSPPIARAT